MSTQLWDEASRGNSVAGIYTWWGAGEQGVCTQVWRVGGGALTGSGGWAVGGGNRTEHRA